MLQGKVAVITGSTAGIGLAIARTLARQCAALVLNGFGTAEEIGKIIQEIENISAMPIRHDDAD